MNNTYSRMNWTSLCPPLITYFLHSARNYHYDIFLISAFALNAMTAILASRSNFVVIYTILRTASLQTPSNILILGLAVSEFCSSVIPLPFFSLYKLFEYKRDAASYCLAGMVYITSGTTLALISFITLTAITADRFLAVKLHLRYQELVTTKRYVITLILIWVICLSAVVLRMFAYGVTFLLLTTITFVSLLVLNGYFIVRISKVMRRHSRQIQAQEQSMQQSINMPTYKKSVNTMYYVIGSFVLCYIPFAVALFVIYVIPQFKLEIRTYFTVTETHVMFNCALNPMIYCWRIKELRDNCWRLLSRLWKKPENQIDTYSVITVHTLT
jgi:hypothetical protein